MSKGTRDPSGVLTRHLKYHAETTIFIVEGSENENDIVVKGSF